MRVALLAIALTGCANGSADAISREEPRDAAVGEDRGRFGVDASCAPVAAGRVCAFLCELNPEDCSSPREQVPITCADPRVVSYERCEAFSFNPLYFSTDTWAYCCLASPGPAGPK